MSEKDINNKDAVEYFRKMLEGIPYENHFRIHKMYNLKVPVDWHIKNRINDDFHLVYVKGGSGTYYIGNKEILLKAGRFIFVSNNCLHSSEADIYNTPYIIPIRFGIYDNTTLKNIKRSNNAFYFTGMDYDFAIFLDKFEKLSYYYNRWDMVGREQVCGSIIYEIIAEILQCIKNQFRAVDNRILEIKQYIDRKANHKITMENLAVQIGMSKKHMSRLFKECYGMAPKQYLIRTIIEKSNFYIDNTLLSLSDIAIKLGYYDLYTFSKQYKNVKGYSPNFRRKNGYNILK